MSNSTNHIFQAENALDRLRSYGGVETYVGTAMARATLPLAAAQQEANEEAHTANLLQAEALSINPLRTDPPLTDAERVIIERLGL